MACAAAGHAPVTGTMVALSTVQLNCAQSLRGGSTSALVYHSASMRLFLAGLFPPPVIKKAHACVLRLATLSNTCQYEAPLSRYCAGGWQ